MKPLGVQVVSLDWKWLFIYPDEGIASVNQLVIPAGTPVRFELTSSGVMNSFFVPQLGSQIYTMAGMVTRLHLQADQPEATAASRRSSAAMASPTCASRSMPSLPDRLREVGGRNAQRWSRCSTRSLCRPGEAERGGRARHLPRRRAGPVQPHPGLRSAAERSIAARVSGVKEDGEMNLLGKLDWSAIPFDQPIIMGASAFMVLVDRLHPRRGSRCKGYGRICGASGSPPSTTSGSASCTSCWRSSCCCAALPTPS